ncbi:metallo-beta-lactamase superfamily protein [Elizabethkingia sp. YR214]|uniref:MBL fold metallo-hydrolase n=1 Tax=Elizabethkingia sp. YR214 TaxID=2135667 RepID=UPI000D31192B|nr:MBL fold metallo-hydrolase [Elizabethkingia sp. YR214]PUB27540.1 metallo-beta-lactamase superfamily protein [Elizabethkingia sp. YR214]
MNRRELLKKGSIAGLFSLLPATSLLAEVTKPVAKGTKESLAGYKKIQLGTLELYILSDGYIRDTDIDGFAPRADVKELKKLLRDNFRSEEYIDMAMNVPLVKTEKRLILMDAGMGIFADENTGFLPESLAKAGFKPEDITDVFISHAHPDHIGGLIDKAGKLVFPNAVYFINKTEYDFWMQATIKDFANSALKNKPDFLSQIIEGIRKILTAIKPKIKYYDFNTPLYQYFSFVQAPGHTPGLTLCKIKSQNEEILYMADLIHSDALLFPHPEWGFSGDTDLDLAVESRKKMLSYLADNKLQGLGYHLTWPGTGYAQKSQNAFRWFPKAYFAP